MAPQSALPVSGAALTATVPARSLVAYTVKASQVERLALPSSFR
ncbi:hypothetical protein [Streptomyces sp. HD]|nr:hypothetical protein [Streptomyces sp. HD]MDC0773573.1 hypothetical protein [Streptomyces sp. HD]